MTDYIYEGEMTIEDYHGKKRKCEVWVDEKGFIHHFIDWEGNARLYPYTRNRSFGGWDLDIDRLTLAAFYGRMRRGTAIAWS